MPKPIGIFDHLRRANENRDVTLAKAYWHSLDRAQRDELGDQFVLGGGDWREWVIEWADEVFGHSLHPLKDHPAFTRTLGKLWDQYNQGGRY